MVDRRELWAGGRSTGTDFANSGLPLYLSVVGKGDGTGKLGRKKGASQDCHPQVSLYTLSLCSYGYIRARIRSPFQWTQQHFAVYLCVYDRERC